MNLQAGFGRADITPDYNVHMQGSDWRNRVSDGIMDRLYTTCVALRQGQETVLIYTLDLKLATKNFTEATKDAVSEATGVPRERVLLSGTHTHSSVAIRYPWDGVEEYRKFFREASVAAAQEALADLADAQVYAGSTMTFGLTFVRHYRMKDGTVCGPNFGNPASGYVCHTRAADPELQLVRLQRQDKKDILMLSFPCHGTFQGNSTKLSADWPSPTRESLEASGEFLVAVYQGSCGDQTPGSRFPHLPIKDYKIHGQKLAQYAKDALPKLKRQDDGALKFHLWDYVGQTNFKGLEKLEDAKKVMQIVQQYGSRSQEAKDAVKQYNMDSRLEANWIIIRSKEGPTSTMELGAVTLGSLAFILAPYEMFGSQGKFIKRNSPFHTTFIITCYDGSYNYVVDKESFDYNCYESQCSYFARGVAEDLAQNYVDTLKTMHE